MRKNPMLLASVAALAAAAFSSPAAAQDAPQADVAQNTPKQAGDLQSGSVDDIVVTAQRRDERLQTVPIDVTAVSGETYNQQGTKSYEQLSTVVPSLVITRQGSGTTVFLRGLGNPGGQIGTEGSVALYIDGVYMASVVGAFFHLADLERVEVLKGPQGTLFGRNASGGVVQIVTKDPGQDFTLDGQLSYGNFNTSEATTYVSAPITNQLATSVSAYYYNREKGWGKNLLTGGDAFTASEYALRNKWKWTPDAFTKVVLAVSKVHQRTQEGDALNLDVGAISPDHNVQNRGFYNIEDDTVSEVLSDTTTASLHLSRDVGKLSLVSITGYDNVQTLYLTNTDASPLPIRNDFVRQRSKSFSQEFQILSAPGGAFSWIVGGYYFHNRAKADPIGLPTLGFFIYSDLLTNSHAAFGQGSLAITDDTKLTVGLRYTRDSRTITGYEATGTLLTGSSFIPAQLEPFQIVSTPIPGTAVDNSASWGKLTWRLSLDHKLTDDIMAYASYNRGFKSGTFSTSSIADPAVNPEIVDAFEVGVKSELFNRRLVLNAAGYYYNAKDMQVSAPSQGVSHLVNAASSRIYGIDVGFSARPVPELTLDGGLNWGSSTYSSFPVGPLYVPASGGGAAVTVANLTGDQLLQAPSLSFNVGFVYAITAGAGEVRLSGNYAHQSSSVFYYAQQQAGTNFGVQPTTDLVDLSLRWYSKGEKVSLGVWAQNVLDQKYYSLRVASVGFTSSPAAPRTYGVSLGYKF